MAYDEFIQDILNTRGRFACGDEYHERHHIIPKCLGGTNDEDNLIDLYAREHYEAHKLLSDENLGNTSLQHAFFMMSTCISQNKGRYKCTAEEYEIAKKRVSECKFSEETLRKMSIARKGRTLSEEHRKHMSEAQTGRKVSLETRLKLSLAQKGKSRPHKGHMPSDETRAIWSKQRKGRDAGGKNPNAKKVLCDGVLYDWAGECADKLGIARTTLRSWLNGQRKMPKQWVDRGLSYV